MRTKGTQNYLRKAIAGIMSVWLSGIVFLFCCEQLNAKPTAEFCPLAAMSEHCDKANAKTEASVLGRSDEPCVSCCGFLPAVFDKARKIEPVQKQIAAAPSTVEVRFVTPRTTVRTSSFIAPISRVPDRHGTYLKNRVFRI